MLFRSRAEVRGGACGVGRIGGVGDPVSLLVGSGAAAGGSPAWRLALGGKAAHLVVKELDLGDVLGEQFVWRGKGLGEGILQLVGQRVVKALSVLPPPAT